MKTSYDRANEMLWKMRTWQLKKNSQIFFQLFHWCRYRGNYQDMNQTLQFWFFILHLKFDGIWNVRNQWSVDQWILGHPKNISNRNHGTYKDRFCSFMSFKMFSECSAYYEYKNELESGTSFLNNSNQRYIRQN